MMCSMPSSGWSETYRPSISRSKFSRVFLSHSASGIATSNAASACSSPPKRLSWPIASLRLMSMTESTACSWMSTRPLRGWPKESNAPALTSDSMTRLLQTTAGTLRRKSAKLVNSPLDLRVATIASTTFDADVADRGHAEPDVRADRGEGGDARVDVRRQDLDAHPAGLRQVERGLVLVVADGGEHGRHVLGGVVRLQVGGPVGDQAVGGGVRLVERVRRRTGPGRPTPPGWPCRSSRAPCSRRGRGRTPCPGSPSSSCPSRGAAGRPARACSPPGSAPRAAPAPGRRSGRRWAGGSPSAALRARGGSG